jgi:hypothetical protein
MSLPIKRVTLYKHGLGFFERRGQLTGEQLRLEFPRTAMDDILKSLVVLDSVGQVLGLEFETPPDRNTGVHRQRLHLSEHASLTDTITALRGRTVRLTTGEQTQEGVLIGVDLEGKRHLERAMLSLYQPEERRVVKLPLERLESFEILDSVAAGDLEFALTNAKRDEDRSSALLRLSGGEHELRVSYIAPAPAWRVSYRVIAEAAEGDSNDGDQTDSRDIFLQGWGLFDNTLEEDLEGVELSLVAGMPVSFRYALFAPNTPERPLVEDEERTVDAPIEYAAMAAPLGGSLKRANYAAGEVHAGAASMDWMEPERERGLSDQVAQSTQPVASGEARGALFAYKVAHPVSVARGQSGMVPLLSAKLKGRRELLYNHAKHAGNPVASLRFVNASGLTLERGPVTVFESTVPESTVPESMVPESTVPGSGEYAGEAVLDFAPVGAEMILAFAAELGVTVTVRYERGVNIRGLTIEKGYLLVEGYQSVHTIYQAQSRLDSDCTLTLEHQLQSDPYVSYRLYDTPEPVQSDLKSARWTLNVPAQSLARFEVKERHLYRRHEEVRGLSFDALKSYLADKTLDAQTYAAFSSIRELYAQAEAADTERKRLDQEREKLYKRQTQIQGNLAPLGQGGEEGKLRSRLVRELGAFEDRLREIETEQEELRALRDQLEKDAAGAIAALEHQA